MMKQHFSVFLSALSVLFALVFVACPAAVGPPGEKSGEAVGGSERSGLDGSQGDIFDPRGDLPADQTPADQLAEAAKPDQTPPDPTPDGVRPEEIKPDQTPPDHRPEGPPRDDKPPERRPETPLDRTPDLQPDLTPDRGQTGDPCRSPCDCAQGLDCQNNLCTKATLPIYCCENPNCPPGDACVTRTGASQRCTVTPSCQTHCDCPQGLGCYKGQCGDLGVPIYCCSKPNCPVGEGCHETNGTPRACPNPQNPNPCKHSCDCPQGLVCVSGTCYRFQQPTYCCDNPTGCPSGEYCLSRTSGSGYCPVTQPKCKGSCDCKFGEVCFNGVCIATQQAPYCCQRDGNRCPSGNFCEDPTGAYQLCGSTKPCATTCDCGPGETCFNAVCVGSPQSEVCCTSPACRTGDTCVQPTGAYDVCR